MSLRDAIVSNALWGVANEKQIHYQQSRPIDGLGEPFKLPLSTDCSGFATDCYQWAGAPDPNGNAYNGLGYTGTLLAHLEHIAPADCLPGDLIVFGPGGGDHVVIATEAGANPMCVSHGQERGPILIRLSIEAAAHRPPTVYLRGEGLDGPDQRQEENDMDARLSDDDIYKLKELANRVGAIDNTAAAAGLILPAVGRLELDAATGNHDPAEIAKLILAGLDPKAIAAAIPPVQREEVVAAVKEALSEGTG